MGKGLTDLSVSTKPIRVLFVATDGLENSSTAYSKSQIQNLISSQKTYVVMLGTLFSDINLMKDLVGTNGVYIYAPAFDAIKSNLSNYLNSLNQIYRISVANTYQNANAIKVTIGSSTATFTQ